MVYPHGLSHLHGLRTFDLSFNRLTTLRADIFNSDDFPESNGHPARLDLKLNGNGFVCNTTMCWLIEGIRSGTIGYSTRATCANGGSSLFSVQINCISGYKYFLFPITTSETYAIAILHSSNILKHGTALCSAHINSFTAIEFFTNSPLYKSANIANFVLAVLLEIDEAYDVYNL